jgi:hypothetical protein
MKLAACGNDCNHCPRYIATQSGDLNKLKEVSFLWNRIGYRDKIVSPKEIACHGCTSSNWCRYGIRNCTIENRVSNCGECEDYPCKKILGAIEKTLTFAENIREGSSEKDFEHLHKAFFLKRANLEKIHSQRLKGMKQDCPIRQSKGRGKPYR